MFRRFGSRTGLLAALLDERMAALRAGIESGPPPLGPGAPPVERLVAFFDAIIDLATRNLALVNAYQHALAGAPRDQSVSEIYDAWHAHVAAQLRAACPGLDADLAAHVLLGSAHADPIRRMLADGDGKRVAGVLRDMITDIVAGHPQRQVEARPDSGN